MDTYDVLVATYVYNFMESVDWEKVKDEEAREIFREVVNTYLTFIKGSGWEEMFKTLATAEKRLRERRNRAKDEETRSTLNIWIVLVMVLMSIALIRQEKYVEALDTVERAYRTARRIKYIEPYIVSAALRLSLKFRLWGYMDIMDFEEIARMSDEPHLKALAFEVLAYALSDVSSDSAFNYIVLYWSAIKDLEGMELFVYIDRLYRMVDTLILRFAYELRSGKVIPEEVDWPDETNDFLDWVERGSENEVLNVGLMNLYVKLLHYITLRSDRLKDDPFNVAERLRKASKRIRESIETLLNSLRNEEEDEGKYDDILKA